MIPQALFSRFYKILWLRVSPALFIGTGTLSEVACRSQLSACGGGDTSPQDSVYYVYIGGKGDSSASCPTGNRPSPIAPLQSSSEDGPGAGYGLRQSGST